MSGRPRSPPRRPPCSNHLTPTALAEGAQDIGKRHGIPATVLDKAAIVKKGMLLVVAQGSAEEPRFIMLDYQGAAGAPVAYPPPSSPW